MIRPDRTMTLLPQRTLAAAETILGEETGVPFAAKTLAVLAKFVRAAGGGTLDVFIQTSLDGGVTWIDVMNFAFLTTTASKVSVVKISTVVAAGATPTDGGLADNTILDGVLGDRIRLKAVVAGTAYSGATHVTVSAVVN